MKKKETTRRTLTPKEIDQIFLDAPSQSEAVVALYKLAFPDWDKITKILGWPMAGDEANKYIFKKAIKFDQEHHKNVMPGGLWMNNGFTHTTAESNLGDWDLDWSHCPVEYGEEAANG